MKNASYYRKWLVIKGMSLTRSLFCRTFSTKTWNFYGILGVVIFRKAPKVELVIMEKLKKLLCYDIL